MISPLEFYANDTPQVAGKRHLREESIYKDVKVLESIPITLYPLGKLILVNGEYISGDKFSHFFNVGWSYYKEVYQKGKPIKETLMWGQKTEKGIWGLAITGVYSNAHLAANYDGMRFWSTLQTPSTIVHYNV